MKTFALSPVRSISGTKIVCMVVLEQVCENVNFDTNHQTKKKQGKFPARKEFGLNLYFTSLTPYLLMSSADNLCKKLNPENDWPDQDPN